MSLEELILICGSLCSLVLLLNSKHSCDCVSIHVLMFVYVGYACFKKWKMVIFKPSRTGSGNGAPLIIRPNAYPYLPNYLRYILVSRRRVKGDWLLRECLLFLCELCVEKTCVLCCLVYILSVTDCSRETMFPLELYKTFGLLFFWVGTLLKTISYVVNETH